jgi:GH15 family glucan-1,4-alpha-glucosidase
MRYLMYEQIRANLSLGKAVEQWLLPKQFDNYTALRWVTIEKNRDSTYTARYAECFDDGDENFTDVYAFSFLNPDEPEVVNNFDSIDEALQFASDTYSTRSDKFVTAGMIQDEYKDYLKSRSK